MTGTLHDFLTSTLEDPSAPWDADGLRAMAKLAVPDRVFRWSGDVMRGDVNRQWAEWMLATFCDVERYAAMRTTYAQIFDEVQTHVIATWQEMEPDEQKDLARRVSRIASAEANRRAEIAARAKLSPAIKQKLIDAVDGPPYCWICGLRFGEAAISSFLGDVAVPELPALVDVYKPIGLSVRHLRIEVDHVRPHSRGGGDGPENLNLCCGWCNIHKSNRLSIYEVGGEPRLTNGVGMIRQLPQPFWTVRIMALEGARGAVSPADGELSVCLRNPFGAPSPANLRVVRYGTDDPLGSSRFQGREYVAKIWKSSNETF